MFPQRKYITAREKRLHPLRHYEQQLFRMNMMNIAEIYFMALILASCSLIYFRAFLQRIILNLYLVGKAKEVPADFFPPIERIQSNFKGIK